jgi:hypothetical protein
MRQALGMVQGRDLPLTEELTGVLKASSDH